MRTLNNLSLALLLSSASLAAGAQELESGTYYLRNVEAGKFLAAGNSWGTQGSFADHGLDFNVTLSNGTYTLDSRVSNGGNNHYLGTNGFVDAAPANFVITKLDNGYYTLACGGKYFGYNGTSVLNSEMNAEAALTPSAQWELFSKMDLEAALSKASSANGVDATFYIQGQGFGRNDGRNSAWQGGPAYGNINQAPYRENCCAEKWNTNFDVYQVIEGVPNGTYELSCQGFYRAGGPADAANARIAGTEQLKALLYANDNTQPLMSIFSHDVQTAGQGFGTSTSCGFVPNSMNDASIVFTNGNFRNNKVVVYVSDNTLRIGVKKADKIGNDWTIFDNFELTYYGPEELSAEDIALASAKRELGTEISSAKNLLSTLSAGTESAKRLSAAIATAERMQAEGATPEEVLAAKEPLNVVVNNARQGLYEATLVAPASLAVANGGFNSNADGWSYEAKPGLGEGCAEYWNTNFNIYQDLADIPNGTYVVSLQAFYRNGYPEPAGQARVDGNEQLNAKLYANANETDVVSAFNEFKMSKEGGWTTETVSGFIPNTMGEAAQCFGTGAFGNKLAVFVTDGKLRIGLKKEVLVEGDWTLFDNFSLMYYGEGEYSLTDIENAEAYEAKRMELRTKLKSALDAAKSTIDNKVNVGAKPFNTPEEALDAFEESYGYVAAFYEHTSSTVLDLQHAIDSLASATALYNTTIIEPDAETEYAIMQQASGLNLALAEDKVSVSAGFSVKFESAGNGAYYITNGSGLYLNYEGSNNWTLKASADKVDTWSVAYAGIVDGIGTYVIKGKNGHLASDKTDDGATVFGDKKADNANGKWVISEMDEKYTYFRNVGSGKFLTAGASWGTQAILSEHAMGFLLNSVGENKYTIDSKVSNGGANHFLGSNGFVDSPAADFTLTEVSDGVYTITADGENYYGYDGTSSVLSITLANPADANAQWEMLTKEEMLADLKKATANRPVDATFMIEAANFGRNDQRIKTAWKGAPAIGGDNTNMCAEKYNTAFDVYQTIEGLPNGTYKVNVQGFYRHGFPDAASASHTDGSEELLASFYANGVTLPVMSVFDEVGKEGMPTSGTSTTDAGVIPNNMTAASQAFSAGLYGHTMTVEVTDGTLVLGVKKEAGNVPDGNWTIFDNFELYYLGDGSTPEHVFDYDIKVERTSGLGYENQAVTADLAEICAMLGVADASEATVLGVNPDGSYITDGMSKYDGWRNAEGAFVTWGADASVCVKFDATVSVDNINICAYPGQEPEAGTEYVAKWALATATDTVLINTVITFTKPVVKTFEIVKTITVNHSEAAHTAYSGNTATFDVAAVTEALGIESIAEADQYIVNVTTGDFVRNTTDGWRDTNGDAANWGTAGGVCVKIQDPASGSIDYIGCYDDTHEAGEVYTARWAFVHGDKAVAVDVVITFVNGVAIEGVSAEEVVKTEYFTLGGVAVDAPQKDVYIVKKTLANGKSIVTKTIVK